MNGRKYIFQTRVFWIVLSAAYMVLFLIKPISVYSDINLGFGGIYRVFEPTYHLFLRKIGVIHGGEFAGYSGSLEPIIYDLPYTIIGVAILSAIIVLLLYLIQRIHKTIVKYVDNIS